MDRYQRVEKPKEEAPINENEIRITAQGRMRNYISYATGLLHEKNLDVIVFKAMGRAINKTVMIVELMKRRIVGLHQITNIASTDITDTWEPLEEGLLPLETTRQVSMITITLSKAELDPSTAGYQHPLSSDQVKQWTEIEYEGEGSPSERGGRGRGAVRGRGGGRGRGRNGRGNVNPADDYSNAGGWENGGRGGRSGRLRGNFRGGRAMRGGYGGRGDYQYEAGGYNEAPNFQGGRAMGGDYGGQGDYQQQYEGGGHGDYQQYEAGGRGGYHDDGPFRGGRGRGRGRAQGRGRGRGYRSNGPPPAAVVAAAAPPEV